MEKSDKPSEEVKKEEPKEDPTTYNKVVELVKSLNIEHTILTVHFLLTTISMNQF